MAGLVRTLLTETGHIDLAGVQEALRDTAIIRGLTEAVALHAAVLTDEVAAQHAAAVVAPIVQDLQEVQHIRGLPHLQEVPDTGA